MDNRQRNDEADLAWPSEAVRAEAPVARDAGYPLDQTSSSAIAVQRPGSGSHQGSAG
jgi:hypothetical protein